MRRVILPAILALAAIAGTVRAEGDNRPAMIVVRLPADATLIFGSQQTAQRGSERRFVSPDLVPGYTYSYEVTARWLMGGKEVTATRTIEFRPGQLVTVDLRRGVVTASSEPVPFPKKIEMKAAPKPAVKKPVPSPAEETGF